MSSCSLSKSRVEQSSQVEARASLSSWQLFVFIGMALFCAVVTLYNPSDFYTLNMIELSLEDGYYKYISKANCFQKCF